jgi:hypothetical protein
MNRQAVESATHVFVAFDAQRRYGLSQEALVFRAVADVTLYAGG